MKRLVLFDIDGTLISTRGIAKETFAVVLERVYGIPTIARDHDFAGKTDLQIVFEVMNGSGLNDDAIHPRLDEAFDEIFEELGPRLTMESVRVHDGVVALLEQLVNMSGITVALLTGNMERGARMKLEPHDLNRFFAFGAFGSDARYRHELPAIAVARAENVSGERFVGKEIVIIGDTPHDVTCGAHLGVRTIAVATGGATHEHLARYSPDFLFHSLEDTDAVIEAIGREMS